MLPAITSVLVVARLFVIKARLALKSSLGTRSLVNSRVFTVALATLLVPVLVTMIVGLLFVITPIARSLAISSLLVLGLVAIRAV